MHAHRYSEKVGVDVRETSAFALGNCFVDGSQTQAQSNTQYSFGKGNAEPGISAQVLVFREVSCGFRRVLDVIRPYEEF